MKTASDAADEAPKFQPVQDLEEFESEDTGTLEMVHPANGEPSGWVWTLAGPGHPTSIEQQTELERKALRDNREREHARINGKRYKPEVKAPEQVRRENAEFYARRVLGWTPIKIKGEPYPHSFENTVSILLNPKMGRIYKQLTDYFGADESFTKSSAKP